MLWGRAMLTFTGRARHYIDETLAAIRADLVIYTTALAYLVVGATYVVVENRSLFAQYDVYSLGCIILCCVALPYAGLLFGAVRIALFNKGRSRLAWRALVAPRRVGRFAAGTLLMLVLLLFVEAMYISVKTTFSASGFPYDKLVADIDKALHFGHAPSYWLSVLRAGWLLRIVETNYDAVWFVAWIGLLYWFATSPRAEALRVRFVLTFMLAWVLIGNLVASLCLTAGPALYGVATGDGHRFAKLATFLTATPNATSATQQYLWALHQSGAGGLGSGISAFPSMHVAITTVCALFLAEIDKRLGIAAWVYVAIIVMSSIYLGWHYAVDGYAAILLTTGIYWAIRGAPLLGRLRRPAPAELPGSALAAP